MTIGRIVLHGYRRTPHMHQNYGHTCFSHRHRCTWLGERTDVDPEPREVDRAERLVPAAVAIDIADDEDTAPTAAAAISAE